MATILNDVELKRLIGAVIIDGDPTCIRPNAYVHRLGSFGEFLNAGKDFEPTAELFQRPRAKVRPDLGKLTCRIGI